MGRFLVRRAQRRAQGASVATALACMRPDASSRAPDPHLRPRPRRRWHRVVLAAFVSSQWLVDLLLCWCGARGLGGRTA